jgi:hypothetical protein
MQSNNQLLVFWREITSDTQKKERYQKKIHIAKSRTDIMIATRLVRWRRD